MVKVTDMIGDYAHPAGDAGRDVDQVEAMSLANNLRGLLNADLDEDTIAMFVYDRTFVLNEDQDLFIAAWEFLNAGERRAWKIYFDNGKKLSQHASH
jgi:hypothetical protein